MVVNGYLRPDWTVISQTGVKDVKRAWYGTQVDFFNDEQMARDFYNKKEIEGSAVVLRRYFEAQDVEYLNPIQRYARA